MRATLVPVFSILLLATSALSQSNAHTGELKGPNGTSIGQVTITPAPNGVILRVEAKGLTPGWHGMHFHEKGNCSDAGFKSAGGHVHAKTPVVHGILNADANDAGDLPNVFVASDGTATVELYSTLVILKGDGARPALLDSDGSSLVVHANPDDYKSQPIGGAGARVACAVIQ